MMYDVKNVHYLTSSEPLKIVFKNQEDNFSGSPLSKKIGDHSAEKERMRRRIVLFCACAK